MRLPTLFRRRPAPAPVQTFAAAELAQPDSPSAPLTKTRTSDDAWQRDAWYQYDICGELRFATDWMGNAVSLADLYIAETDPTTGLTTERAADPRVQAVGAQILGGASRRPQLQKTSTLNWLVAGEAWILVRPAERRGAPDQWLILSSREVRQQSGKHTYIDPDTGRTVAVTPDNRFIRLWNPHPARQTNADSAVRAAMPTLREIERTSQSIAARLVSRIASNGVWLLPNEIDFPAGDDDPGGAAGVMAWLARAGEAAMADVGQASSQMPLVMTVPGELLANIQGPLQFASDMPEEILELRAAAIRRLATAMDMPAEIMLGMGDSNHWSAWQIEESAYKLHIEPMLDRLAEALTRYYLWPVLEAMRVTDWERYVVAFDTSELVTRPNRLDELNTLHDKDLISDEYLRAEAGVPEGARPDAAERTRRILERLVTADPALINDPAVRDCLDVSCEIGDAPTVGGSPTQAPGPGDPTSSGAREIPARAPQTDEGGTAGTPPALVAAAELAVFDALSRAGARMLTREYRGQFAGTPKHELYRVLPVDVDAAEAERLLADSFTFIDGLAEAHGLVPERLRAYLGAYTANLLIRRHEHRRGFLAVGLTWVPRVDAA